MIRYALACAQGHAFEGWFAGSDDYDDQAARGLLSCPVCASAEVGKQIMAPALAGSRRRGGPDLPAPARAAMMEVMTKVRRHVETHFDYVGDRFAREARDIHEGRSEERGIYGEASRQEVKALAADGISVAPLPPEPPKKIEVN